MFLTLDSAWKLLIIAFYGLFTFNADVWAQITPMPGGVSSFDNRSNLSSSTGAANTKPALPASSSKARVRPLLNLRPDPELPPAPPAGSTAKTVAASTVAATMLAPTTAPAPSLPVANASNVRSEKVQDAKVDVTKVDETKAQETKAQEAKVEDAFMAGLASDLSDAAPALVAVEPANPVAIGKNSALNPAQAKAFVVQASAVGEVPPTPPLPPAPANATSKAVLPAPSAARQADVAPESIDPIDALERARGQRQTSDNAASALRLSKDAAAHVHIGDQTTTAAKPSPSHASVIAGSNSAIAKTSSTQSELPAALGQKMLESIEFEDVPLTDAMKLFAEQSGLNVITSADAGKTRVTVFLKQVSAHDALEAIVKANGLFYRVEAASGIVRIATSKEYEKDLSSFREEQTRVFTLLYPNPIAVAQVIQQVFGNRVQMNRADADMDDLLDLSRRFNRFDMVDGRSLGLGSANNNAAGGGRNSNSTSSLGGRAGQGGGNNALNRAMGGNLNGMNSTAGGLLNNQQLFKSNQEKLALNDLSAEEIQRLENEIADQGELAAETQADLLQRRDATIYISTIRRNNQIIVRTGDNRSMEQIAKLINQLDVPTPTVLLEVKVLRIVLADGFNSAFEYFGAGGNASAAMSDGALQPTFPGASAVARGLGAGLGVAGGVPGALSFQMVDDKFRVRMQLLESKNCVTALATPLILTANNEVSRIFVGDTLPFTVGFTPSQVLASANAVNGAVAATPVTELRDVGQSLLITPNINADRTVTLRVIEENSERVLAGSSIPVPATSGTGVTNINVDTVRRRTISGTIVAQDGMAVALGGLIEEQVHDARDQVPVLGNIPGLGLLFRRQSSGKSRSELVVIVRPYVFNTPTESAATTEMLLGELSTHPNSPDVTGTMNALPCPVTRSESESSQRAKLFQLHNRSLSPN